MGQQSTLSVPEKNSPGKMRPSTPRKRLEKELGPDEMKQRFIENEEGKKDPLLANKLMKTVNTTGAHTNREDEWYFGSKSMLFASKSPEIVDTWIDKLGQMVEE